MPTVLQGTEGPDTLQLDVPDAQINGAGGDDYIRGFGVLRGDAGDDTISGNGSLYGGTGDDTIQIGGGSAFGEDGNDNISASGAASIDGGSGSDTVWGSSSADTLAGGDGADTIDGAGGNDQITLGPGLDVVSVHAGIYPTPSGIATVHDWSGAEDRLLFDTGHISGATLIKGTAADFASAQSFASTEIGSGAANFVAVQVGADVVVFADETDQNQVKGDAVILAGRTLADISPSNFITGSDADPALPSLPWWPAHADVRGTITGNMDTAHLSDLTGAAITTATSAQLTLQGSNGVSMGLTGSGLTYDAYEQLNGGTASHLGLNIVGLHASLSLPDVSAAPFASWVAADATAVALETILAGNDAIDGFAPPPTGNLLRGFAGDDYITNVDQGSAFGGVGDDVMYATSPDISSGPAWSTYLRGEEGNDYIVGGFGFDDINGNQGNDTANGSWGDDWVVGGKDQDLLAGGPGNDIVYGNLGDDTCSGGGDNDLVRGGQGDDMVYGGSGRDWISGDRGDDTITGGTGADTFHGSQDAGMDLVTDFRASDGDHVQLDAGTTYTLSQVGLDTVIDMGGGNQMILQGVQLSALPAGWIFEV